MDPITIKWLLISDSLPCRVVQEFSCSIRKHILEPRVEHSDACPSIERYMFNSREEHLKYVRPEPF